MTAHHTDSLPQCSCGHTRLSLFPPVEVKASYSAWGWFLLLWGITVTPIKVAFKCLECGQAFDESVDPQVLKHHVA